MKKMHFFQRLLCLILAALIMLPLMGCQTDVSGTSIPLTEEKKEEISNAWEKKYGYALDWGTSYGPEYYATYGDCVVFLTKGVQMGVTTIEVANQKFIYRHAFSLEVYRAGDFMYIEQAYEDGYLTRSQIKELAKHHQALNQKYYND